MKMEQRYVARRCGTVGCEILNQDGKVVAWTVDSIWAARIVQLLEMASEPDWRKPPATA